MVKTFSILGFVALSALSAAIPTPEAEPETALIHTDFSFAKWVDSIIADPKHALTPEQALAAANASISSGGLEKRQTFENCRQLGNPAKVPEAVWCINYLASQGANGQNCPVTCTATAVCTWYQARIHTQGPSSPTCDTSYINCNQVARAAGVIMDNCWRADQTVAGRAWAPAPDERVLVHLSGP
ncbi:hypothetical protein DM02DRAFT_617327 [Periconia macrospinosa]|uniref:Secreted protein n=1 Tax=Periconia macrospinosa TaxID=97972 RepID=A0A2V1DGU4_9PLEO|nr:hypothetical protein DM02DRAFT_617327 [Periconia macrospinosa]